MRWLGWARRTERTGALGRKAIVSLVTSMSLSCAAPRPETPRFFDGVSATATTGTSAISSEGLVAAYDMSSLTPDGRLRDFGGNGLHGIRENGGTFESARFGLARVFRTVADRVQLPARPPLDLDGPLTIAVRLRVDSVGIHQHVVACDDKWALWITPSDQYRLGDTRGGGLSTGPLTVRPATWTTLVAVLHGSKGDPLAQDLIAFYIDGARIPALPAPRTPLAEATPSWNPAVLHPADACYIGFESHQGDPTHRTLPFVGAIDELVISARAWSDVEARAFARPTEASTGGIAGTAEAMPSHYIDR